MGYYENATFDFKIKKNKQKQLLKKIKEMSKDNPLKQWWFNENFNGIDKYDYLDYRNYYQRWYYEEDFLKFIKDYAEEGYLTFLGEDSEISKYYFDGKGEVYEVMTYERVGEPIQFKKN